MNYYDTMATTREGQRDASLLKFGSKDFDGTLPNDDIISPFPYALSIPCYPLGVSVEPAHKKKSDDDCNQSIVADINWSIPRTDRQPYWNQLDKGNLSTAQGLYHAGKGGRTLQN